MEDRDAAIATALSELIAKAAPKQKSTATVTPLSSAANPESVTAS